MLDCECPLSWVKEIPFVSQQLLTFMTSDPYDLTSQGTTVPTRSPSFLSLDHITCLALCCALQNSPCVALKASVKCHTDNCGTCTHINKRILWNCRDVVQLNSTQLFSGCATLHDIHFIVNIRQLYWCNDIHIGSLLNFNLVVVLSYSHWA